MELYTDHALAKIRENTGRLYAMLASLKPNEDLSREDIESLMYYIKAFGDSARTEEYRRKRMNLTKERKA